MNNKYLASMLLSAVGDAVAYKNGKWEFEFVGKVIHEKLAKLGGIEKLKVAKPEFIVSDDTVMHIATAEALIEWGRKGITDKKDLFLTIAKYYKECMKDMNNRSPGATTINGTNYLDPSKPLGYQIKFNPKGGGCGGAMRSMVIGLYFHRPEDLNDLIEVSIEAGRMTHNHPTGYLGSLVSAFFTHLAVQGHIVHTWGAKLMQILPKAWSYIELQDRDIEDNKNNWGYFVSKWEYYLKLRGIEDGFSEPHFPEVYDVTIRDKFYKSVSYNGWGGSSGHDAPMIAYDALLGSGNNFKELAMRGFFHGGDSDSTAVIAAAWFGVLYGLKGVSIGLYQNIEYKERIEEISKNIYDLVHK